MLRASIRPALLGALLIALSGAAPAAFQTKAPAKAPATAPASGQTKAPAAKPAVNATALAVSDFLKRVDAYVALQKKLEDTLPKLSKQTNPQEIDAHERALAKLVQEARKDAKQGDILTVPTQRFVRRVLAPIFSGKEGAQIKDEILDKEYKGGVKLAVNGRYPDEVPVSTMPPQVLAALPKLPPELEYRFIQNNLIIFDSHAHLIADFMASAFN
jgi:hypothetical protein